MQYFDVAIIGSGPSGASAAYELSQKGISVVIIEKETLPRYKTCGGGFVYRGRKKMPFDISEVVEREFFEIETYFKTKNVKITSKRDQPIISMIMRDTFDHLIVKKSEENGIKLLQNHKLLNITFGELLTIHTTEGDLQTKFVIAADGALSPTAKITGWEETRTIIPALEYELEVPEEDFKRLSSSVRFDINAIPYGYGWCFPKKNHLSVGVGVFIKTDKKINLKNYYAKYLETLGIHTILKEQAHGFVIPVTPRTDSFAQKGVFLIGDAAGFADPMTAEGISNAIYSGKLAAESIIESNLNANIAEKLYHEKLEKDLLPELRTGAKMANLFYGNDMIVNMFIKKYGQIFSEAMTDVFMGTRTYPTDYKAAVKRKIKEYFF